MKRRLRKKLRVAEFCELGFKVRFRLPVEFDERDRDAFWDLFIGQVVEGNGLLCGGSARLEWDFTLFRGGNGSATEADRIAVRSWLSGHRDVFDLQVGPLIDIWHFD